MAIFRVRNGFQKVADGTYAEARGGLTGELCSTDTHGRYFEATRRNRASRFFAATPSGQTTTVGLATTYVGLILSNPVGNTFDAVIDKAGFAISVITAAVNAFGFCAGYNASTNVTHTAAVTPQPELLGIGPASTMKVDTSATLPTAPLYHSFLNSTPTATTNPNGQFVDLEGSVIVPPGGYFGFVSVAATAAAAFWGSLSWEEVSNQ